MDPGTALGVVSLGIQVCQGITWYYGEWKDCPEDVAGVAKSAESLGKTFELFNLVLADDHLDKDVKQRVEDCIQDCRTGIGRLDKKLKKFDSPNKTKKALMRTLYPFKADTIRKLKGIVGELLGQLSLAVQLLHLQQSQAMHSQTRQAVEDARKEISSVKKTFDIVGEAIARVEAQSATINDAVSQLTARTASIDLHNKTIESNTTKTASAVQRLLTEHEVEALDKILRWISAPDPTLEFDAAIRKRHPGSGQWFLDSREYASLKSGHTQRLWLYGKAGCCKSVLSAVVVQDLATWCSKRPDCLFAYFYFTFSDPAKQSYRALLKSVINQMSRVRPVSEALRKAYDQCRGSELTTDVLESLFDSAARDCREVFVVIDALDESPDRDNLRHRTEVCDGLIRVTEANDNIHFLITSRDEPDIREFMSSWYADPMSISSKAVDKDIEQFVTAQLENREFRRLDHDSKRLIAQTLSDKADGMFRWASLQLDELRRLKVKTSPWIRRTLNALPKTLYETYDRMLVAIDDLYFEQTLRALQWLSLSKEVLTASQLAEAMSLDSTGTPAMDEDQRITVESILDVLPDFIAVLEHLNAPKSVDKEDVNGNEGENGDSNRHLLDSSPLKRLLHPRDTLRLAHFSIKEYLTSNDVRTGNAHRFALTEPERLCFFRRASLAYLISYVDSERRTGTEEDSALFPLLDYTLEYHHWYPSPEAQCACNDEADHVEMELALLTSKQRLNRWNTADDYDSPQPSAAFISSNKDEVSSLYVACLLGLHSSARRLIEKGEKTDLDEGYFGTPLQAALYKGHWRIAELLVENGADVNHRESHEMGSPLQAAVSNPENPAWQVQEAVSWLLRKHADPKQQGGKWGTALYAASLWGFEGAVRALVDAGAEVNAVGGEYGTALQAASYQCYVSIVKILLDAGAALNATGVGKGSALRGAACASTGELVRMLLDAGADVNASGDKHGTALQAASASLQGGEEIVSMLLHAGAKVNAASVETTTALQAASSESNKRIVRMLLDAGAEVNAVGGKEGTALQRASARRDGKQIVRMLLNAGAEVNAVGGWHGTALGAAHAFNRNKIAELLLGHGAKKLAYCEKCAWMGPNCPRCFDGDSEGSDDPEDRDGLEGCEDCENLGIRRKSPEV